MLDEPLMDWRSKRREAASAEIVRVAWELARENGLAGLSLRDLARRLGMAAPSLYSYFASKNALYDAMYADGWRALLAGEAPPTGPDLRAVVLGAAKLFARFAAEDPARYLLLNQRTIPGFEPTPESYAVAVEAYEWMNAPLLAIAEVTQEDVDLLVAFIGGLINQQLANEPGGTRWFDLIDDAVDLLLPRLHSRTRRTASTRPRRSKETT
jgi:AcrR family transcriptional regulator